MPAGSLASRSRPPRPRMHPGSRHGAPPPAHASTRRCRTQPPPPHPPFRSSEETIVVSAWLSPDSSPNPTSPEPRTANGDYCTSYQESVSQYADWRVHFFDADGSHTLNPRPARSLRGRRSARSCPNVGGTGVKSPGVRLGGTVITNPTKPFWP